MKQHILSLTLIAALLGVALSVATKGNYTRNAMGVSEFLAQCQRASDVPVVIALPPHVKPSIVDPESSSIDVDASCTVFVVDSYAQSTRPYLSIESSASSPSVAVDSLWFCG